MTNTNMILNISNSLTKRFDKSIHVLGVTQETHNEELFTNLLGFLNMTYGVYLYQPQLRPLMEGVLKQNLTYV